MDGRSNGRHRNVDSLTALVGQLGWGAIENHLFAQVSDLFGLGVTVALFDLSNTYFEGMAAGSRWRSTAIRRKTQRLSAVDLGPDGGRQRLRAAFGGAGWQFR